MSFKKAFKSIFNLVDKQGAVGVNQLWSISKVENVEFNMLLDGTRMKGVKVIESYSR